MKKQFENVNCATGSPMGRKEWRDAPTVARSVRVFRVRIDSQGYDDGGAYWGIGKPLFCATDGQNYRMFTRADSRLAAVAEFRLDVHLLALPPRAEFLKLKALEQSGRIGASGVMLRQRLEALGFDA